MAFTTKEFCTLSDDESSILSKIEQQIDSELKSVEWLDNDSIRIEIANVQDGIRLDSRFYLWIKYIYEKAGWEVDISPRSLSGSMGYVFLKPMPF